MKTKEQYRKNRNTFCWVGVALGIFANGISYFIPVLGIIIALVALTLNITGCYNWAKYKGRSPAFCLWGLIAPIGFIGLAVLKDKWQEETPITQMAKQST